MTEADAPRPGGGRRPSRTARGRRRRVAGAGRALSDDLLGGFERDGRPIGVRAFFAVTIGTSVFVFDLAFTLGAYHTVFYTRLLQIVVVSTVLLLGTIVLRGFVRVRWWSKLLLAVPLVWFLQRLVFPSGRDHTAGKVLDDVLVGLTLASVPVMLVAVARVLSPEYFALPRRRFKVLAILIVALVAVGGFLIGLFNYRVTTCQDYVIAGNDTPKNCRQQPFGPPVR